jgi:hypothetical protein
MVLPADLDDFSPGDLKNLVLKLFEEVAELWRTVAAQRDEIIRLKGGPGRPNIKPSGMDKATEPKASPTAGGEARRKGSKTSKLSIHEERTVKVATPPPGSRFKGYTNFVVQDLVIRPHVVLSLGSIALVAGLLKSKLDLSSTVTRFGFVCLDRLERGLHTQQLK